MVLLWAVSLGHTGPVDLSKIDRTVGREPAYRTQSPKYCLLLFGPEAKTRVWLVHDGDRLYVDRNGNGDLSEEGEEVKAVEQRSNLSSATKGERVESWSWKFDIGAIREGQLKHDALVIEISHGEYSLKEGKLRIVDHTFVTLKLEGKWQQSAYGPFSFARRPQDAPVIHFNGPLTIVPRYESHNVVELIMWRLGSLPRLSRMQHQTGTPHNPRRVLAGGASNPSSPQSRTSACPQPTTASLESGSQPIMTMRSPSRRGAFVERRGHEDHQRDSGSLPQLQDQEPPRTRRRERCGFGLRGDDHRGEADVA
jgi:hypothetical protein